MPGPVRGGEVFGFALVIGVAVGVVLIAVPEPAVSGV